MFFFNIPQHGDLHLDKILFSFENVPMIFVIIPELSEPPVRTLGATIPENESHIFR